MIPRYTNPRPREMTETIMQTTTIRSVIEGRLEEPGGKRFEQNCREGRKKTIMAPSGKNRLSAGYSMGFV